jgi:hypothetical protein
LADELQRRELRQSPVFFCLLPLTTARTRLGLEILAHDCLTMAILDEIVAGAATER